jgi:hypothetical protein
MTIQQTVDIPASRRLTIEVPPEVPVGRATLIFMPAGTEKAADGLPRNAADIRRRYFSMSKEERAAVNARDMELINRHAGELNQEAADALKYQIDLFETTNCSVCPSPS